MSLPEVTLMQARIPTEDGTPRSPALKRLYYRARAAAKRGELNAVFEWSTDLQDAIIDLVSHGATLTEVERLTGMPSIAQINRRRRLVPAFDEAIRRAQYDRATAVLDEAHDYLRLCVETGDPDAIRGAEAYVRAATSYAERTAPKEYGALLKHAGADGGPLQVQVMQYTDNKPKDGMAKG